MLHRRRESLVELRAQLTQLGRLLKPEEVAWYASLFRKLAAADRAQAVALGFRWGFLR